MGQKLCDKINLQMPQLYFPLTFVKALTCNLRQLSKTMQNSMSTHLHQLTVQFPSAYFASVSSLHVRTICSILTFLTFRIAHVWLSSLSETFSDRLQIVFATIPFITPCMRVMKCLSLLPNSS